jgi:Ecdysteroid kinase-like family
VTAAPTSIMPSFPEFPGTPEEMTTQWLSAVIQANGIEATVVSISQQRIGTGQIGQNIRFELTYEGTPPTEAPTTLVGKFVSPDETSRATGLALGIYAKEAIFYRTFAPTLSGRMRLAKCWAVEFNESLGTTILLMEDLAPAVQGDQMAGCTLEEAELAIQELAALHATFWEHEALNGIEAFAHPTEPFRAAFLKQLLDAHWPLFIERYADRLSADQIDLGNALVSKVDLWVTARQGPLTLVHGDYRADNLMITAANGSAESSTVAVDWQTVAIGYGGIDLGYFIGASLTPDLRRANQQRLVTEWVLRLEALGVTGYEFDRAWDDYRNGQFGGFITAVVSSMITGRTDRGDEMFWTMADRHLTTAIETNAASLLPA